MRCNDDKRIASIDSIEAKIWLERRNWIWQYNKKLRKIINFDNVIKNITDIDCMYFDIDIDCMYVTYTFQSESTLFSCLNLKELLARSRWEIWHLSDWNWTRTQNHLVRKRTLNHFARLAKELSYLSIRCIWLYIFVMSRKKMTKNTTLKNDENS